MTWLIGLGILGILDAGYLTYKARKHEVPVCPLGQTCSFVLKSEYNNVLGVKNEVLGLLFYIGVVIAASASRAGILALPDWLWLLGLGGGFAMALALTAVQVFVLKAYCSWCLASALINALLFVVAYRIF